MSVDLLNFVEVREWTLSSYKVSKKFGGAADKNFVTRTNAFVT